MAFLLDHLPAALHLVLIARAEPPLPLDRLRGRSELSELDATDSRFSPEETRAFLDMNLRMPLPSDVGARIAEHTEGWPAGLRLLTLALESKPQDAAQALAQRRCLRRVFLNEGRPMAGLLQAMLPQLGGRPLVAFGATLLQAHALHQGEPAPHASVPLLEPLSPQEVRVLRLLVAGLSNPEIAQELVVSTNTIKTQVRSIYRKLDVSSRDQACQAARELGLL